MKTMKKLSVATIVAISLAACQQEKFEGRPDSGNYYASVETFATGTKTALGDNRSVVWSSEDRIAIFEGEDVGLAYQVLDSYVGKSSGEFAEVEGLMTEGTDAAIEGTVAVYPFNEDLTVISGDNGGYVIEGIAFPSEQKYIAGSFSDEAFPMTAVCEQGSKNLSFKNVGGVLKLSLTGSYSVSSITLTGNSGELLSGPATVTLGPDGIPSVTMSDGASTSVTLVCDHAVELNEEKATDFYISIPPTDFESGFTIIVADEDERIKSKLADKRNEVLRSFVLKMPKFSMDEIESSSGFGQIDEESLKGSIWETGVINGDGDYILLKRDLGNRICIAGNEKTTPLLYFVLNEQNDVIEFLYEDLYCTIEYDDEYMYTDVIRGTEIQQHIFDFKRDVINANNLEIVNIINTKFSGIDTYIDILKDTGKGLWNITNLGGAVNLIVDCFKGRDISRDFNNYSFFVFVGQKFPLAGYVGSAAYETYKAVENYHKEMEAMYFDDSLVKISQAYEESDGSWTLLLDIEGLPNMYSPSSGMKVGVLLSKNKDNIRHPNNHGNEAFTPQGNSSWIVQEINIDDNHPNHSFPISVFISDGDIHYARPYLIPYMSNGWIDIESTSFIRYGEIVRIPYPMCETGEPLSITTTSAVVECTFSNIPEDGQCQVLFSGADGHKKVKAENREGTQSIILNGLEPNTTYSYCASIDYEGGPVNGEMKEFTTEPKPSMAIVSINEITDCSAVVKCKFKNVEDYMECGIIIKNDNGFEKTITAINIEEEQKITISGLTQDTKYICVPYVKWRDAMTSKEYYYEGNERTFCTSVFIPDISGTWICNQGKKTYSITLKDDHTVEYRAETGKIYSSSWSINEKGRVTITVTDFVVTTTDAGRTWNGKVDNMENPTQISGSTHRWNSTHKLDGTSFIMTR